VGRFHNLLTALRHRCILCKVGLVFTSLFVNTPKGLVFFNATVSAEGILKCRRCVIFALMTTKFSYTLTDLPQVAQQLQAALHETVVFFEGEMGAGKTTLISAMIRAKGCTEHVSSPTFSLVNTYVLPDGQCLYHMDLYRINQLSEALDMGIEDYLYSGQLCWIEWPDRITPLWPEHYQRVQLLHVGPDQRLLQLFSSRS